MKHNIKLLGVLVEVDGKEKLYKSGEFELHGWETHSDDPYYAMLNDSGLFLKLRNKRKNLTVEIGNQYFK